MKRCYSVRFILYTLALILALSACMTDERFSDNPSLRLTANADTLNFDTVFSGEVSSTRTLWLYNSNTEHVRIVAAALRQGTQSPFTINIDGLPLYNGVLREAIEMRAGDSLRLFARISPEISDRDTAHLVTDELRLTLESGQTLVYPLRAYAQDAYMFDSLIVAADTTLTATRPIRIMKGIAVQEGKTLTLSAGTRLYMHSGAHINVYGTLRANGTATAPIHIRGDRLDWIFSKQPYARIPGQWGGITFKATSFDNKLDHCEITSGHSGLLCDSSTLTREKLRLENSLVHNMVGDGLTLHHVRAFIGNSQITNAGGNCVSIAGGAYDFIHCTIGSFYSFAGTRGVAFAFSNALANAPAPLARLNVINSIVTGYSTNELTHNQYAEQAIAFEHTFHASLINTNDTARTLHFTNCLWDNEQQAVWRAKNFAPAFDLETLVFTFALDSLSPARGLADASYTLRYYPHDRLGKKRPETHAAAGCYEP